MVHASCCHLRGSSYMRMYDTPCRCRYADGGALRQVASASGAEWAGHREEAHRLITRLRSSVRRSARALTAHAAPIVGLRTSAVFGEPSRHQP